MIHPRSWLSRSRSLFARAPRRRTQPAWSNGIPSCERLEDRVLLCEEVNTYPTIANLTSATVADDSGYGAAHLYLKGDIVDTTPIGSYRIMADENGDGTADSWATYARGATSFAFLIPPLPSGPASGTVSFWIVETVDPGGDVTNGVVYSASYTQTPPANSAPQIRFASIQAGYGSNLYFGEFRDTTPRGGTYVVEVDGDRDGVAENSVTQAQRGAFSIGGYRYPGVTGRIRVKEEDGYGREYSTGWFDVGAAQSANNAPSFGGGLLSTTIAWGNITAGGPVGPAVATDPDPGTTLTYTLTEAWPDGFGVGNRWFNAVPTKGVSINGSGAVTVADPKVIQDSFLNSGKYSFGITADDGETTGYALYTINDDWTWWISQSSALINQWSDAYSAALGETRDAGNGAAAKLGNFFGDLGIVGSSATDIWNAVYWAVAPVEEEVAEVGEAVTSAIMDANAREGENNLEAVLDRLRDTFATITANSDQLRAQVRVQKDTDVSNLASNLGKSENTASADLKALQASGLYRQLAEAFNYDPADRVASVTRTTIIAPSADDIYGWFLVGIAEGEGFDLHYEGCPDETGNVPGWYSGDTDWWFINNDGPSIADELNNIGYKPDDDD